MRASTITRAVQSVPLERVRRIDGPHFRTIDDSSSCYTRRSDGPVIYWMTRDQRAEDHWGLLFARELANQFAVPLTVLFNLVPQFLEATSRQYDFMLRGLEETESRLREKNIPFVLLRGTPSNTVPLYVQTHQANAVITDFSPLRMSRQWAEHVARRIGSVPLYQVDSHNVVPVWEASDKLESAARTLRPKLNKLKGKFLVDFPPLEPNEPQFVSQLTPPVDWKAAFEWVQIDRTLPPVSWLTPGTQAGRHVLQEFITNKLPHYRRDRNNPTVDGLSNLSPYFHFGQISPQRAIMEVEQAGQQSKQMKDNAYKWVEEAFVFQELSDNYCFHQPQYDQLAGAPSWAQKSLQEHREDKRPYVYTLHEFDQAKTHSAFWNAMQTQLVQEGKLHGWCRMTWGKGILEWSESPEEALRIAILLNDRYNLDGRDPNGYLGCLWSIAGATDRPFPDRKVFGTVRYKSVDSSRRRFNVDRYINKYSAHPLQGTLPQSLDS